MIRWIYILCAFIFFTACNKNEDFTKEELIAQEVAKRMKNFRKSKIRQCKEESLEIAIHQTDSILKLNAVRYRVDSLKRPPLPNKPNVKIKPPPRDSIINKPFLGRKEDTIPKR